MAYSWGSRTSTSRIFSPRSRRSFNSRGEISRSVISLLGKDGQGPHIFKKSVPRYSPTLSLPAREKATENRKHHEKHDHNDSAAENQSHELACSEPRHVPQPRIRSGLAITSPTITVNDSGPLLDRSLGRDPLFFDRLDFAHKRNILRLRKHFL